MLAVELFRWWYGSGWKGVMQRSGERLNHVSEAFSVTILLRTLFSPWRRIITPPGRSLNEHARAALDNAVSRFIGFLVRLMALMAAASMLIGFAIAGFLQVVLWPIVPFAAIGLVLWGILG